MADIPERDHGIKGDCTWIMLGIIFSVVGILYLGHHLMLA